MQKIEKMECGGKKNSLRLLRMLRKREGGPYLAISTSRMTETPPAKYWVQLRHILVKEIPFKYIVLLLFLLAYLLTYLFILSLPLMMVYLFRRKFGRHKRLGLQNFGNDVYIRAGIERQRCIWVPSSSQSDHANWNGNICCHQGHGRSIKYLRGVNQLRYHGNKLHGNSQ